MTTSPVSYLIFYVWRSYLGANASIATTLLHASETLVVKLQKRFTFAYIKPFGVEWAAFVSPSHPVVDGSAADPKAVAS